MSALGYFRRTHTVDTLPGVDVRASFELVRYEQTTAAVARIRQAISIRRRKAAQRQAVRS